MYYTTNWDLARFPTFWWEPHWHILKYLHSSSTSKVDGSPLNTKQSENMVSSYFQNMKCPKLVETTLSRSKLNIKYIYFNWELAAPNYHKMGYK